MSLLFLQAKPIKQSQLLNRLVLERQTTEEIGHVDQLLLDYQAHRVVALRCKSGLLGTKKRYFAWGQIESIGTDSILVNTSKHHKTQENTESWDSLIGHEVWTDAGNKIGKLVDYLLKPKSGTVVNYLFSDVGWHGVMDGMYLLPPVAISSIGSKRVIVLDAVAQNSKQYGEGLNQKIGQATDLIKEDYQKTVQEFQAVKQKAQHIPEQLKDKAQSVTEQLKDKAKATTAQFKDKAQSVTEQLKDRGNATTAHLKDKAQSVTKQLKDKK
ncbi:PRC-barrel domain-containing protein [Moorena sp. SIO4A5]|uniref:PRC-barrel domain-containing protein n=1 Tax=Moorena sp. SIO4A5 TaxID=2607838 RepID=UPI0013C9B0E7|nr:PRC-barrel domain-containing protein [Moorena sp. SIO4A5]NEO23295.1 photosystem reaction center subunit H [Moorena sp. SIO4A5]